MAATARSPRSRSYPCQSSTGGRRRRALGLPPTSRRRTRVSHATIARERISAPPSTTRSRAIGCWTRSRKPRQPVSVERRVDPPEAFISVDLRSHWYDTDAQNVGQLLLGVLIRPFIESDGVKSVRVQIRPSCTNNVRPERARIGWKSSRLRICYPKASGAGSARAVPVLPSPGLLDRLRRLVPRNRGPPKIRLVGHVTGERRVVAKDDILDHRLPG